MSLYDFVIDNVLLSHVTFVRVVVANMVMVFWQLSGYGAHISRLFPVELLTLLKK